MRRAGEPKSVAASLNELSSSGKLDILQRMLAQKVTRQDRQTSTGSGEEGPMAGYLLVEQAPRPSARGQPAREDADCQILSQWVEPRTVNLQETQRVAWGTFRGLRCCLEVSSSATRAWLSSWRSEM